MQSISQKYNRYFLLILSILFWTMGTIIFLNFGVKNVNDSHRYLEYATNLKQGIYIDNHNFWYLGYVFFIYFVRLISRSDSVIILIIAQYIISYISLLLLYKANLNLFDDKNAAFICALSYLIFIEILFWNSYILSESLYISLTCISFYFLSLYNRRKTAIPVIILASFVILLTILTKPTGIALLGGIISIVIFKIWNSTSSPYLRFTVYIVLLIFLILLSNQMLATFIVIENYTTGEVVYGVSTVSYRPEFQFLLLEVPENLEIPSKEFSPIVRIAYFIIFNTKYWLMLFLAKLFFFLFHVRPYWSIGHNLYNIVILLPIYFYSIRYIIRNYVSLELKVFSITFFLIHTLSIGITSVDWDGRFLMPLLPLLFILSSTEIMKALKNIINMSYTKMI